jgi:hypothetical protein
MPSPGWLSMEVKADAIQEIEKAQIKILMRSLR